MTPLLAVVLASFGLGALLMGLANRTVGMAQRRARWLKFLVYFAIVTTVLAAAGLGRSWLMLLLAVIVIQGARELQRALARRARALQVTAPPAHARQAARRDPFDAACWLVFALLAVASCAALSRLAPTAVAFVYVVVASFDGFSQVVGQAIGRHRLAPRISPGKSVEGVLGGLAAAMLVALVLRHLWPAAPAAAALLGAALAAAALTGDLSASLVKRRAGLKDYGQSLPGHGGVLDRFDSLLPALALAGCLATGH